MSSWSGLDHLALIMMCFGRNTEKVRDMTQRERRQRETDSERGVGSEMEHRVKGAQNK